MNEPLETSPSQEFPAREKGQSRAWTPDRIEGVMSMLSAHFTKQDVAKVVNPAVLLKLGEESAAFYSSALSGVDRPQWARTLFPPSPDDPSGFPAFVTILNDRLMLAGIEVKNAKRQVVSHPWSQLTIITAISDLYYAGELEQADALTWLKEEGEKNFPPRGILLSPNQLDFYFGTRGLTQDQGESSAKAEELHRQVRALQKYLQVDLSDRDCLRGLLFESFVGVVLTSIYGAEKVQTQRQLPITYTDLEGRLHRSVRLDFFVHGEEEPVYEVKLRNDWQNIVTSVLAQGEAVRINLASAQAPKTTVIHRAVCGEMTAAISYNLNLNEEAELMRIPAAARPISETINYIGVERLIERVQDESLRGRLSDTLSLIDKISKSDDSALLKEVAQSLEQIRRHGSEINSNLRLFSDYYAASSSNEHAPLSRRQITALYGLDAEYPWPNRMEVSDHLFDMQRQQIRSRERILLRIAQHHFGSTFRSLTPELVASLSELPATRFSELAFKIIAESDSKRRLRLLDPKSRQRERDGRLLRRVELLSVRTNAALVEGSRAIFEKHKPAWLGLRQRGDALHTRLSKALEGGWVPYNFDTANVLRIAEKHAAPQMRGKGQELVRDYINRLHAIQQNVIQLVAEYSQLNLILSVVGKKALGQQEVNRKILQAFPRQIELHRRNRAELLEKAPFKPILDQICHLLENGRSSLSATQRREIRWLNIIGSTIGTELLHDAMSVLCAYCEDLLPIAPNAVSALVMKGKYILEGQDKEFKPDLVRVFCEVLANTCNSLGENYRCALELEGVTLKQFRNGAHTLPSEIARAASETLLKHATSRDLFDLTRWKEQHEFFTDNDHHQLDFLTSAVTTIEKIFAMHSADEVVEAISLARSRIQNQALAWVQLEPSLFWNIASKRVSVADGMEALTKCLNDPQVSIEYAESIPSVYRLYLDVMSRKLFQAEILAHGETAGAKEYAHWFLSENPPRPDFCELSIEKRISNLLEIADKNDEMFNALMSS